MGKQLKVVSSEVLCKGPKFYVLREKLDTGSGKTKDRDTVVHPGAAVFAPLTGDGNLMLARQYRYSVKREILEFPAGSLDANEDGLTCAKREIQEEMGVEASEWISLGTLLPAPGISNEVLHCYLARGLKPKKLEGDEEEQIEVVQMSVSQVEDAIKSGEIQDGKTLALFARARLLGYF
jgi:ADP-ribose pyrophosphatase